MLSQNPCPFWWDHWLLTAHSCYSLEIASIVGFIQSCPLPQSDPEPVTGWYWNTKAQLPCLNSAHLWRELQIPYLPLDSPRPQIHCRVALLFQCYLCHILVCVSHGNALHKPAHNSPSPGIFLLSVSSLKSAGFCLLCYFSLELLPHLSIFSLPPQFAEIFGSWYSSFYCVCHFSLLCVIGKFDKNVIYVFIQVTDGNIEEDRAEIRLLWKAARTPSKLICIH